MDVPTCVYRESSVGTSSTGTCRGSPSGLLSSVFAGCENRGSRTPRRGGRPGIWRRRSSFNPQWGDHLRNFVPEGLRVGFGSSHHLHEVIRLADDPVRGPPRFRWDSRRFGVPWAHQRSQKCLSNTFKAILASSGEMFPPCGVPVSDSLIFPQQT